MGMGIYSLVIEELSSRKAHCNGLDFNILTPSEGEASMSLQFLLCKALFSICDYAALFEV
jgi:hypothetical protein